jgi:hypothetical protein
MRGGLTVCLVGKNVFEMKAVMIKLNRVTHSSSNFLPTCVMPESMVNTVT